jgi:hypothetical protein
MQCRNFSQRLCGSTSMDKLTNNKCSLINFQSKLNVTSNSEPKLIFSKSNFLRNDMQKTYPEPFLDRFDCQLNKNRDWLTTIYLKKQAVFHPLQHLLFIRFLFGSMTELIEWLVRNEHIFQGTNAA